MSPLMALRLEHVLSGIIEQGSSQEQLGINCRTFSHSRAENNRSRTLVMKVRRSGLRGRKRTGAVPGSGNQVLNLSEQRTGAKGHSQDIART